MGVPTSGVLSMKAMAQEALYGTYGSGTITNPISLNDMVNGTGVASGNTYPAVNTNCTPNPVNRGSYVVMATVFQGETGRTPVFVEYTYYLNPSEAATTRDINDGDTIYTDAALTTPVGQWDGNSPDKYYQFTASGGAAIGGTGCSFPEEPVFFETNSSGEIINIDCASP